MNVHDAIAEVRDHLSRSHAAVDPWFDKPAALRAFHPTDGGWNIDQVLEHLALTSHFLLKLIEKGRDKALKNTQGRDLEAELAAFRWGSDKLEQIGMSRAFAWIRPEHMEPRGERSLSEIREEIRAQYARCSAVLDDLKRGEGLLCLTTMTVNDLGKLNVYEYVWFLSLHAVRHVGQMERIEREYRGACAY